MALRRSARESLKRLNDREVNDLLNDSDDNVDYSSDDSDEVNFDKEGGSGTESSDEEGSGDGGDSSDDGDGEGDWEAGDGNGGGDGDLFWRWGPCTNDGQRIITFMGSSQIDLGGAVRSSMKPLDMFLLLLDKEIIEIMVQNTNQNAANFVANNQLKRSSRFNEWVDTDQDEMRKFMGIRIWMGLHPLATIADYWSESPIYTNSLCKHMTRNRFQLLLRFWHFGPDDVATGRLHKIQPLVDALQNNFAKIKKPGRDLVVDESMVPFRGRLIFRQYLPAKRHRYGIKEFKVCDPQGYTYKIMIYCGKGTSNDGVDLKMATQVVLKLTESYLDCGRIICGDNFYSSMELVDKLLERGSHFVGTVRKNRKGFSKEVVGAKLKKGETAAMQEEKTGAILCKWKDKRDVLMVSTTYDANIVQLEKKNKRGEIVKKPKMVVEYNKVKGGIDLADTLSAYYSALRKTVRWYHKVADDLIFGTTIVNASLLWNASRPAGTRATSLKTFREELVFGLLDMPSDYVERAAKPTNHYLAEKDSKEGKAQRSARGRCKGCYQELLGQGFDRKTALNKTKRVKTRCSTCPDKPFYCLTCFQNAHESSPRARKN